MKTLLKVLLAAILIGILAYAATYKSPQRKIFETSLTAAQQGDVTAQIHVAHAYLTGNPVKTDVSQAVSWYQKAAAQGHGPAAYELAELYLTGEQIERDIPTGISYLKLAAAKDYAPAQYSLGRLYQTGAEGLKEHLGQAIGWWLHAAQAADADAQAALEMMQQENPDLVKQVQTVFEAEQQAQAGSAEDLFLLAQTYQQGVLLEQDDTQALSYYQQAANKGYAPAHYALYEYYTRADGPVAADEEKALEYLQQAAAGGFDKAQYVVGDKIYQIAQTPQEYEIVAQWFERAAAQKNADALYMRGLMYMQGQGGPKNITRAITYFKQAADLGNVNAQYVLGQSYLRAIGQKKNKSEAIKWLSLAKQNGHEQAALLLEQIN